MAVMIPSPPIAMLRLALTAISFTAAVPALAQDRPVSEFALQPLDEVVPAGSLEGSWALKSGETIIFRFDLTRQKDGRWSGVWQRPDSFGSDGNVFVHVRGPVEAVQSIAALDFAGLIELTFPDARPGAVPDIFRFRLIDGENAELTYVGTDLAPYPVVRVTPLATPGPWEFEATYRRPVKRAVSGPVARSDDFTDRPDSAERPETPAPRITEDFLDGL